MPLAVGVSFPSFDPPSDPGGTEMGPFKRGCDSGDPDEFELPASVFVVLERIIPRHGRYTSTQVRLLGPGRMEAAAG